MESKLLEEDGIKRAPVVIWRNDSPVNAASPASDIVNGASTSPTPCDLVPSSYADCTPAVPSGTPPPNNNNNVSSSPVKNGEVKIPAYNAEGVKFIESDGQVVFIDGVDNDDSICSSGSDDEGDLKKPKVPDGGWGWMVVLASFVVSMIADGISFSFGLLYIEFLNHFGESKAKTAWIGSLFMAVPLLTGPIMSALVDRYGCRKMTMLGGIISGIGFILAMFGDSVEWELVTFGVIAGLGLGLCYVTAVVSVCFWFEKKRTLATGLGACGTGFGTFVYAPMTQFFIEEYGWRGTVLMLAGTFLNMCVCGSLMRDPDWLIWQNKQQASIAGTKSIRNASSCGSISAADRESIFPGAEEIRNLIKSGQSPEYILTTLATTIAADSSNKEVEKEDDIAQPTFRSVVNLPTFVKESEKVPLEVIQQLSHNTKIFNVILENYPSLLYCRSMSDSGKLNQIVPVDSTPKRVPVTMSVRLKATKKTSTAVPPIQEHHSLEEIDPCASPLLPVAMSPTTTVLPPALKSPDKGMGQMLPYMRRQLSLKDPGHHYLKHIRIHRNSVMYRGAVLNTARYHLKASSCPNIFRNSMTTIARETEEKWYADAVEMCRGMFDFSMFLELHFFLMSFATILLFTWFIVPYFYLTEHMTRNGYTEKEGSAIISTIGLVNALSMVFLGWCGDQPWVNVSKLYSCCLMLCGCTCILMPIITFNFYGLGFVACLFGMFFASNYSFTPAIVVELIPMEKFTTAYGLILLCQGIGNLLGPPLAGFLFDITESWDLSFYMAGVWIMVSGVLVWIIPNSKNRRIWGSGMLQMDRISNA